LDAWNGKGNALAYLKKYEQAIECYDKAIEIDPKYVYAWNGKGNALAYLKKYEHELQLIRYPPINTIPSN